MAKKIFILLNRGKTKDLVNNDFSNDIIDQKNSNENNNKIKQPILPFQIKKKENIYKKSDTNFRLPSINFLEKNQELKNRKSVNDHRQNTY